MELLWFHDFLIFFLILTFLRVSQHFKGNAVHGLYAHTSFLLIFLLLNCLLLSSSSCRGMISKYFSGFYIFHHLATLHCYLDAEAGNAHVRSCRRGCSNGLRRSSMARAPVFVPSPSAYRRPQGQLQFPLTPVEGDLCSKGWQVLSVWWSHMAGQRWNYFGVSFKQRISLLKQALFCEILFFKIWCILIWNHSETCCDLKRAVHFVLHRHTEKILSLLWWVVIFIVPFT